MAQFDLHNSIHGVNALHIGAISTSTTTVGTIIDTKGYDSTTFEIIAGAITDGTYVPTISASDNSDMSSPTVIVAPYLIGTANIVEPVPTFGAATDPIGDATFATSADAHKVARIGCLNKGRYVRLSLVSTSVTTGGTFGAIAILGHAQNIPTPKDK